jgi:hypothetical protein
MDAKDRERFFKEIAMGAIHRMDEAASPAIVLIFDLEHGVVHFQANPEFTQLSSQGKEMFHHTLTHACEKFHQRDADEDTGDGE